MMHEMGFELQTREIDHVIVMEAAGKLTLTDGQTKLRDLIHVFAEDGRKKFILNLARVEFIDSYGIGELVRSYLTVRQRGGDLKLASVSQKVLHVLTLTGLTKTFEIHADDAAALQAFGHKT
jgi:anti-sigma B factor antagonist